MSWYPELFDSWFEYPKIKEELLSPEELPYERNEFPAELMEVPTSMGKYEVPKKPEKKVTLHDKLYALVPTQYKSKGGSENVSPIVEASNPRIPRKKGQPAKSKKHSDLYTDEDPKGTIHGLGFKDVSYC